LTKMTEQLTYWKRVRYNGDTPPWILKEEENKGFVAYATRDFKAGEWICTEFPVCWIEGHHPFKQKQVEDIISKTEALSKEDYDAFHAMANVFPEEHHPAVGIFMTNCFDMTESIYGECCAMYLALARLNHSCTPNVQQTHLPDTTEEVVYAVRDILAGEEINDCYIDLRQDTTTRQTALQEYYRFHCTCSACNEEMEEGERVVADGIRTLASKYEDHLITHYIHSDQLTDGLQYLQHTVLLVLETASAMRWSVRYLPEAYLMAHELALALRQHSLALKYLKRAYKLNCFLQSDRSPDSLRAAEKLKLWKKKHPGK